MLAVSVSVQLLNWFPSVVILYLLFCGNNKKYQRATISMTPLYHPVSLLLS